MTATNPLVIDLAAARGTPGEKWIDLAVLHGLEDPNAVDWRFTGAMPDMMAVASSSRQEAGKVAAVGVALGAINQLRHRLGLPGVTLSPDRIHLMSEEDYWRVWPNSHGACTYFGHAYFIDTDPLTFWHDLAQELPHLVSYWRQELWLEATDDGLRIKRTGLWRTGLRCRKSDTEVIGAGLDETAADTIAYFIRQSLIQQLGQHLEEDAATVLLQTWDYPAHANLVTVLGERLIEAGRAKKPLNLLLRDFFHGTDRFIQALDGLVDTALLQTVNAGNPSVADFAERNGLDLGYDATPIDD